MIYFWGKSFTIMTCPDVMESVIRFCAFPHTLWYMLPQSSSSPMNEHPYFYLNLFSRRNLTYLFPEGGELFKCVSRSCPSQRVYILMSKAATAIEPSDKELSDAISRVTAFWQMDLKSHVYYITLSNLSYLLLTSEELLKVNIKLTNKDKYKALNTYMNTYIHTYTHYFKIHFFSCFSQIWTSNIDSYMRPSLSPTEAGLCSYSDVYIPHLLIICLDV